MNFNKVILIGRLTRDVELRYLPKGTAVAKLGFAVNRRWTNEVGEKREEVTFVDVDAFGKQAETLSQYVKKGDALLCEGRLRQESWDDKTTGQKRSKLGVVLESFRFMGTGKQEPASAPRARGRTVPAPAPVEDDDVPF